MKKFSLDMPTANELFSQTDDGSGGWLQTAKRRLKFRLRYWAGYRHLKQIRAYFLDQGLDELTQTELPLMLRPMRPYLWGGLGAQQRTQAMLAHYEWMMQRHSSEEIVAFFRRGNFTYYQQTYPEGVLSIELEPARGLGREGELELHLKFNGAAVMRAAFSVLPAHLIGLPESGHVMVIGNMQGQRFLNQEIKIVTQKMERTRPQNIVMTALQGLATGWGLVAVLGVSDKAHVYAGYRGLSQRVGQSYDELWKDLGSTEAVSAIHWRLPTRWVPRPETEVPSHKRSQLRRKNEIRQKIFDELVHQCNAL